MDLGFLDTSSGVTPLLVRLYDNHRLYLLAQDRAPSARAELTEAVSQLLEMKLSLRESELIADVLIALIRQTERDLRQALSEKLSKMDHVPLRVILNLANDEIDVAAPVLKNSKVLTDMDLIFIIKSKGQETWPHIASRHELSDTLIDILSSTRDFDTALALINNQEIELTETALHILSDMAQGQEILAEPLIVRQEVPAYIASKLYQYVGEEIKARVSLHHEIDKTKMKEAADAVVHDFVRAVEISAVHDFKPSGEALHLAKRIKNAEELTVNYMLGILKQGQIQSFVAAFSQYADIPVNNILAMLEQPNGQSFAVTCKALKIIKADFISFYLLTNRLRNNNSVADVSEITKALTYFDRIKVETACRLIENFRKDTSD
ncbi:MAG: DUF2336 domain-containing protein [Alphaproteobacteria bacterium]